MCGDVGYGVWGLGACGVAGAGGGGGQLVRLVAHLVSAPRTLRPPRDGA